MFTGLLLAILPEKLSQSASRKQGMDAGTLIDLGPLIPFLYQYPFDVSGLSANPLDPIKSDWSSTPVRRANSTAFTYRITGAVDFIHLPGAASHTILFHRREIGTGNKGRFVSYDLVPQIFLDSRDGTPSSGLAVFY